MKKFLLFLLLALPAFGQGFRVDAAFPLTLSGPTPYLVANPSPTLSVCAHPANNGVNVACTNYVTTYTSATLGTPCPNGQQDVPQYGSSTCQATGDAQGNIGFFIGVGQFDYTICYGTICQGPFTVTTGTTSSSGLVFNQSSVTLSSGTATFTPVNSTSTTFNLPLNGGNCTSSTFVTTGIPTGTLFTFNITEDAVGGRTFAWPGNVLGGITIDVSAVPSSTFTQVFQYNGTNLIAQSPGVIYP